MAEEVKKFQSENRVSIVGELVSLEIKDMMTKTNVPMKTGNLKVRTAEGEVHTVRLMQMAYFKNDPENTNDQYKALQTIEEEYITEEDTKNSNSEHFGDNPTIVSVSGSMEPNVFKTKSGEIVEDVGISGRFINRVVDTSEEFKATLRFSGFVHQAPTPEVKMVDGEETETGRFKVVIRGIDFQNKAFPVEFIAGKVKLDPDSDEEFDAGAWIEEEFEAGQTVVVDADIINRYIVQKVERPNEGGFGKMVDTKRDVQREYSLFSALEPISFEDLDEDDNADRQRAVFPDQMKEALANYETYKADRIASSDKPKGDKSSSGKRGAFGSSDTAKPKAKGKGKDLASQLPF